jgi:hypothetical protein
MDMSTAANHVPVRLSNGAVLLVTGAIPIAETTNGDDETTTTTRGLRLPGSSTDLDFSDVGEVIEGIATDIVSALQKVKPAKTSVEFGLELKAESGGLLSMLAKGGATGDLKITLEWGE